MNKRWKTIILLIALVQIAIVMALLVIPSLVQSLPGEVRVRLAHVSLGEALLDLGKPRCRRRCLYRQMRSRRRVSPFPR